jgi:hypothetical protein
MRTVTDFKKHRFDGHCVDLEFIGRVEHDGLWATPEGHALAERLSVDARARNAANQDA